MIDWLDESGLPKKFVNETFHFVKGQPQSFYQNVFENCSLKLDEGAAVAFLGCHLMDCTLDPPIIRGEGFGAWSGMFHQSIVQAMPAGGITYLANAPSAE